MRILYIYCVNLDHLLYKIYKYFENCRQTPNLEITKNLEKRNDFQDDRHRKYFKIVKLKKYIDENIQIQHKLINIENIKMIR